MSDSVFLKLSMRYIDSDYAEKNDHLSLVEKVLNDPLATHFAKALDMDVAEYMNLMLKIASTTQGFLKKEIQITIKDREGTAHDITLKTVGGTPLTYADIIVQRSGPLFAGILSADDGDKYLAENYTAKDMKTRESAVEEHMSTVMESITDADARKEVGKYREDIANYLKRPINTARKLSDLDMVVGSLLPLEHAIERALKGDPFNETTISKAALHVATKAMWEDAGVIDIQQLDELQTNPGGPRKSKIQGSNLPDGAVIESRNLMDNMIAEWEESLREMGLLQQSTQGRKSTFIRLNNRATLIQDNERQESVARLTKIALEDSATPYHGAVEFTAPEVEKDTNGEYKLKEGELEEHGDVVMDASSFFAPTFHHDKNRGSTIRKFTTLLEDLQEAGLLEGNLASKTDPKFLKPGKSNSNSKPATQFDIEIARGNKEQANHNRHIIIEMMLDAAECLKEKYPNITIDEILDNHMDEIMDIIWKENVNVAEAEIKSITWIAKYGSLKQDYLRRRDFINNFSIFEEAGKKEAQSQLFIKKEKVDKIVGNISDITPYISGLQKHINRLATEIESNQDIKPTELKAKKADLAYARAHLDQVKLSFLLALPRWSIAQQDHVLFTSDKGFTGHEDIGQLSINAGDYTNSLNRRCLSFGKEGGIRRDIKWADIDETEAGKRLEAYTTAMDPIWEDARSADSYFEALDAYRMQYQQNCYCKQMKKPLKQTSKTPELSLLRLKKRL